MPWIRHNALDTAYILKLLRDIADETENYRTNSWQWKQVQRLESEAYSPPPYRFKWNLAGNSNFETGVIYMAQMNPKEPACFEMLGIAACCTHNYNLGARAFEKAVVLGSNKTERLQKEAASLRNFIRESFWNNLGIYTPMCSVPLVFVYYFYTKVRDFRRKRTAAK